MALDCRLASDATRVLHQLGLLDEIRKHATFPKRAVLMDAVTGREITTLDLGQEFLSHFGYPYIVMHRGDLLAAQLDACGASKQITLEANKEAVAIEDLVNGAQHPLRGWFRL